MLFRTVQSGPSAASVPGSVHAPPPNDRPGAEVSAAAVPPGAPSRREGKGGQALLRGLRGHQLGKALRDPGMQRL
ncbi:UNVERIFIED_CONTAM: hypothetical protein PYX00_000748 [Menopon gallinae]|uniref:Uncharacterized protein n=1 Tax=Menopon gallinae TaxID=328185 RepID=A0AAW2IBF4_9NEOP